MMVMSCARPLRPTDQSVLRHMTTDRVRQLNALTHQRQPDPVEHHDALLLTALDLDEPHRRPGDRFTDRLGIGSIVLLALYIGLT